MRKYRLYFLRAWLIAVVSWFCQVVIQMPKPGCRTAMSLALLVVRLLMVRTPLVDRAIIDWVGCVVHCPGSISSLMFEGILPGELRANNSRSGITDAVRSTLGIAIPSPYRHIVTT